MHHANMVRDVVAALQETMDVPAEPEVVAVEVIPAPSLPLNFDDQMANSMAAANSTQQQMFQKMQTMMETMQYMTINNGRVPSNQGGKINRMGVGITTTATMETADIRVTTTEIKTTMATTIMKIATTAKTETH